MLKLREGIKVYVSLNPIDARKSIDSLSQLVIDQFKDNPQSGHLFLFFNKARDKVKVLWWDTNGFILHYKRLEKRRFHLPKLARSNINQLEISETQLHGLLAGLDFTPMKHFPEINYHHYA
jgi:transposase